MYESNPSLQQILMRQMCHWTRVRCRRCGGIIRRHRDVNCGRNCIGGPNNTTVTFATCRNCAYPTPPDSDEKRVVSVLPSRDGSRGSGYVGGSQPVWSSSNGGTLPTPFALCTDATERLTSWRMAGVANVALAFVPRRTEITAKVFWSGLWAVAAS